MAILCGRVTSGVGDFAQWICKLHDHYQRKTGLSFYPGTLNLELDEPYSVPDSCLRLEADEYGGTVSVSLIPCRVFGLPAFILRTDRNQGGDGVHSRRIIEVACEVKLRDEYGLVDGDEVQVVLEC